MVSRNRCFLPSHGLTRKQRHDLSKDMNKCKVAVVKGTLKRGMRCYETYDSSLKGGGGMEKEGVGGKWSRKAPLRK